MTLILPIVLTSTHQLVAEGKFLVQSSKSVWDFEVFLEVVSLLKTARQSPRPGSHRR